jgi:hypothetical protein
VIEAAPDRLVVSGRLERVYPVRCEQVANPPGLPDRDYVVAWTTGPADVSGHQDDYEERVQ